MKAFNMLTNRLEDAVPSNRHRKQGRKILVRHELSTFEKCAAVFTVIALPFTIWLLKTLYQIHGGLY